MNCKYLFRVLLASGAFGCLTAAAVDPPEWSDRRRVLFRKRLGSQHGQFAIGETIELGVRRCIVRIRAISECRMHDWPGESATP